MLHPLYCGITALPAPYVKGDYKKFEWDSAWWVSNLVSNLCYDRWSRIAPDVKAAQAKREGDLLRMQPIIEEAAAKLGSNRSELDARVSHQLFGLDRRKPSSATGRTSPGRSWSSTSTATSRAAQGGRARGVGYSPEWLKRVVTERPEQFKVEMKSNETDH